VTMDIVCLWAEMSTGRFARGVAMFMGRCGCGRNVHIHIRYVVLNLIGPRVHLTKCSLGESSLANGPPGEVSKGQNSMGQNVSDGWELKMRIFT
jgi:hypothetical protein